MLAKITIFWSFSSVRKGYLIFALISAIILNIIYPTRTFAADTPVDPKDKVFCASNSINYISCGDDDQCTSSSSPAAGTGASGASDGSTTPGLTAEQAAFVDKYHDIAEKLSIEYGIPWETVLAQGILESGAGTSNFAVQRNNFFGIGAFDSNPNNAYSFATPEEGFEGYFKNIVKTPTYRNHGVFQGATVTDPYAYLNAIKAAGYATDPQYIGKVSPFIKAIEARSQQKGWKSSADLAKEHPEMLSAAAANAQGGASSADSDGAAGSSSSGCSSTAPTGSIAAVATEMGGWGAQYQSCYIYGGGHGRSIDWLKEAIANHFTGSYGVDCSAFVRAVIFQATGKDPGDLATSGMCASPNYEHIPRSEAQPGDIAMDCANHTEVITAVNGGVFSTVGSHTTGCGPGYGASPGNYQGTESFVLRFKG